MLGAAGGPTITSHWWPMAAQGDQPVPAHVVWYTRPSVPRVNTVSLCGALTRPTPHGLADGAEVSVPRSEPGGCSHDDHADPVVKDCHSRLSAPRTKTSTRPGPHDAALGGSDAAPGGGEPRPTQPGLHAVLSQKRW